MAKTVIVTADKIKKRKHLIKFLQMGIVGTMIGMTSLFMVLNLVYNGGKFSIDLDQDFAEKAGIVLYEDSRKNIFTSSCDIKPLAKLFIPFMTLSMFVADNIASFLIEFL